MVEIFRYNKEYKLILRGKVVLAGHSLPQLSILETFRYNKEYKLIFRKTGIRNAAGISYMRPAAFM